METLPSELTGRRQGHLLSHLLPVVAIQSGGHNLYKLLSTGQHYGWRQAIDIDITIILLQVTITVAIEIKHASISKPLYFSPTPYHSLSEPEPSQNQTPKHQNSLHACHHQVGGRQGFHSAHAMHRQQMLLPEPQTPHPPLHSPGL